MGFIVIRPMARAVGRQMLRGQAVSILVHDDGKQERHQSDGGGQKIGGHRRWSTLWV
jgi:hypothetical protein